MSTPGSKEPGQHNQSGRREGEAKERRVFAEVRERVGQRQ